MEISTWSFVLALNPNFTPLVPWALWFRDFFHSCPSRFGWHYLISQNEVSEMEWAISDDASCPICISGAECQSQKSFDLQSSDRKQREQGKWTDGKVLHRCWSLVAETALPVARSRMLEGNRPRMKMAASNRDFSWDTNIQLSMINTRRLLSCPLLCQRTAVTIRSPKISGYIYRPDVHLNVWKLFESI